MLLKSKIDKFNKLKSFLKNNNVLANLEERYCYAQDSFSIKKDVHIPDLVVFVETIEDVQKIVKYANEHEIPIVSRGAGTNMVGACIPLSGGIILNFSRMNKILDVNLRNFTVTVQPGVILGDLKEHVESLGLFYPPNPSNYKVSTVGGGIAQSSGGANSFKYGTTKDYIISLKVVTSDGKLMTLGANTSKDSVGYHLNQLIVGSEGTLAIIVEATLKLIPKPETKRSVLAYFDKTEDAVDVVDKIIVNHLFPSAIDFMDKKSVQTVESYSNVGFETEHEALLLIELDGFESSMKSQITKIEDIFASSNIVKYKILDVEQEAERIWQARCSSFAATARLAPNVVSDDIIVPRENISKMVSACNEIVSKYGLNMCMVGHIGDGNLHPQIALDLDNENDYRNFISAKSEIYKKVVELGGTISAEHGVGVAKLPYIEKTLDKNSLELMKIIKKGFDPKGILNPGKIFKL